MTVIAGLKGPFTYPSEDSGTGCISLIEVVVPLSTYHSCFVDTSGAWTPYITTLSGSAFSTAVSSAKALWIFLGVT